MSGLIAWCVERLTEVDSTNATASERVRALWQTAPAERIEGLVIVAERQRAGRGQHGRAWESPVGGLYLSAVVERLPVHLRDKLALIAGVAVAEGLKAVGIGIGLRWPNDLMLGDRKVGGILCESVAMGERWAGIMGIGLNVNTQMRELSETTRLRATSLLAHDGECHDMREIERAILSELAATLDGAGREGIGRIVERARAMDALRGRQVEVHDGSRIVRGVADGLGEAGELLVSSDRQRTACVMGTLMVVDGRRVRD